VMKMTRKIAIGIVTIGIVIAIGTLLTMKFQADSAEAAKREAAYQQGQALTTDTPPTTPISRRDQQLLDDIEHSLRQVKKR
ncbi:MAG: hypothetical protein WCG47_04970, partial [Dermatophilaceae bacterium]